MPKQLVISPTQINYVDVSKDLGIALMRANRTLYINKADDPDKSGRNTASKEMLAAVEDMAKAKGKQKSAD
jgi:hypothetical protein